jgi:hypothetical protein
MIMCRRIIAGLAAWAKRSRLGSALVVLGLLAGPLAAQPAPPSAPAGQAAADLQARSAALQASLVELAGRMANDPRMRGLSAQRRQERVAFVVGNLLFVLGHELGHAVISEFDLPVLGREEDTADVYAISKSLTIVNNELSHRALMRASTAWFMSARRARRDGEAPAYHEQHGLDEQRAYHIICLMVGSDPDKFKALADEHRLPEERRASCVRDYHVATRSWQRVMGPNMRASGEPKAQVNVIYGEARGSLDGVARSLREIRVLEHMAEFAAEQYRWPAPITIEMRSCGEVAAAWTFKTRTVHVCYEMVDEFVALFNEQERDVRTARRSSRTAGSRNGPRNPPGGAAFAPSRPRP